jgi:hypothetical protein
MKKVKNKIYQFLILLLMIGIVSSCWPVARRSDNNSGFRNGNGMQLRDGSGNGPCTW